MVNYFLSIFFVFIKKAMNFFLVLTLNHFVHLFLPLQILVLMLFYLNDSFLHLFLMIFFYFVDFQHYLNLFDVNLFY
jgi:hypothetical protein